MKIEKRSIGTCILLSIITLGIYGLVWEIRMAKEAISVKDEKDSGTLEIVLMIFLPFLGYYLTEKKFAEGCHNMKYEKEDRSIIYLVLGLFGLGLIAICMLQSDLNRLYDALSQGFMPKTETQASVASANPQEDVSKIVGELEQYKALFEQGVISEEEYLAKRDQLLNMI